MMRNKNTVAQKAVKGIHFLIDLYGCDACQLNSPRFWEKTLSDAADAGHMKKLKIHFHQFEPQGITGFLLLSASHMSVHTWPEYNYAACDIFSCSDGVMTEKAAGHLLRAVSCTRKKIQKVKRGYTMLEYLESPIYATGKVQQIRILQEFAEARSSFQSIAVADLKKFGKSLIIDGLVQTSEYDHERYDAAILAPLRRTDQHILILGGGDGYVAERALAMNPGLRVTVVDLDQAVVDMSKKYLDQKIFSHPHVTLIVGDALQHLKVFKERGDTLVDGIVSDLTDNPIGTKGVRQKLEGFYTKVLTLVKGALRPGGWVSAQAGASKVTGKYIDEAKIIEAKVRRIFGNVRKKSILIPSYGEKNTFVYAQKTS